MLKPPMEASPEVLCILRYLLSKYGLTAHTQTRLMAVDANFKELPEGSVLNSNNALSLFVLTWKLKTIPSIMFGTFRDRFSLTRSPKGDNVSTISYAYKYNEKKVKRAIYPRLEAIAALDSLKKLDPNTTILDLVKRTDGSYNSDFVYKVEFETEELPACAIDFCTESIHCDNCIEASFSMLAIDLCKNVEIVEEFLDKMSGLLSCTKPAVTAQDSKFAFTAQDSKFAFTAQIPSDEVLSLDLSAWEHYSDTLSHRIEFLLLLEKSVQETVVVNSPDHVEKLLKLFVKYVTPLFPTKVFEEKSIQVQRLSRETQYQYCTDDVYISRIAVDDEAEHVIVSIDNVLIHME